MCKIELSSRLPIVLGIELSKIKLSNIELPNNYVNVK